MPSESMWGGTLSTNPRHGVSYSGQQLRRWRLLYGQERRGTDGGARGQAVTGIDSGNFNGETVSIFKTAPRGGEPEGRDRETKQRRHGSSKGGQRQAAWGW
jgi:hypothetical protein